MSPVLHRGIGIALLFRTSHNRSRMSIFSLSPAKFVLWGSAPFFIYSAKSSFLSPRQPWGAVCDRLAAGENAVPSTLITGIACVIDNLDHRQIPIWTAQKRTAVSAGISPNGTLQAGTDRILGLLQQSQNDGKSKGLAACNAQTASPFGSLNNFYPNSLSDFLVSLHFLTKRFFILRAVFREKRQRPALT